MLKLPLKKEKEMQNKTTSPYCKLFTRFLKEHGLFGAWKENARNYYRGTNIEYSVPVIKTRQLETVWGECNSELEDRLLSIRRMKIYSLIDMSLYWDKTPEGRIVWDRLDSRWRQLCDSFEEGVILHGSEKKLFKDIFARYATERIINNLVKFTGIDY